MTRFLFGSGWPYLLVPFIPIAIALEVAGAGASAGLIFVVAALGIVPTAALMGLATEELAARSGPGIGGLLNVTFGNAPEIIIALFALNKGLHEVVKASLIGSILGNTLLVADLRRFLLSGSGWPYLLVPFIPIAIALELAHADAALIFGAAAAGMNGVSA